MSPDETNLKQTMQSSKLGHFLARVDQFEIGSIHNVMFCTLLPYHVFTFIDISVIAAFLDLF